MCKNITKLYILLLTIITPLNSIAEGFGINTTRLIYQEGKKNISVTVRNSTKDLPYLVKSSIATDPGGRGKSPFHVSPSLFRLEPNSNNNIKISLIDDSLPIDKESVFYFNSSAIPSSERIKDNNNEVNGNVVIGVGNIIKMFYRPKNLPITSVEAQKKLDFTRNKEGLYVANNSPYFISFSSIKYAGKNIKLEKKEDKMLAPFSNTLYKVSSGSGEVIWNTINDEGGVNEFKKMLN